GRTIARAVAPHRSRRHVVQDSGDFFHNDGFTPTFIRDDGLVGDNFDGSSPHRGGAAAHSRIVVGGGEPGRFRRFRVLETDFGDRSIVGELAWLVIPLRRHVPLDWVSRRAIVRAITRDGAAVRRRRG